MKIFIFSLSVELIHLEKLLKQFLFVEVLNKSKGNK